MRLNSIEALETTSGGDIGAAVKYYVPGARQGALTQVAIRAMDFEASISVQGDMFGV